NETIGAGGAASSSENARTGEVFFQTTRVLVYLGMTLLTERLVNGHRNRFGGGVWLEAGMYGKRFKFHKVSLWAMGGWLCLS
ncbi:MAG: hypothetical protein AB7E59_14525, partial [Pusillimonas sp.]